jgi:outer membrane protein TolC
VSGPRLAVPGALCALLVCGSGAARGEVVPTRELTLEQTLAMARHGNRSLVAERARLIQAEAIVDRAWTVLFPTVSAQGRYTRNNTAFVFARPADMTPGSVPGAVSTLNIQPLNQLDASVSVVMPLLVPAAYPGLKAVDMTARATQENIAAAEDSVLFGVAQTFYAAAIADEVLVARQSAIAVARATLENAKTRFDAGAVTKVDVDRAQLAVLRAEQSEREAKLGRDQTYRALATLIQVQEPFRVRAPGPTSPPESHAAPAGELVSALSLRPEFRALQATVEAEDAERRSHAWRWAPSLSGFGNARVFNYDNFAQESHAWAVGAQLDWVIYDGGVRDTQRRLSGAQAIETAARAEVLRDSIRDDLVNGRRQLETKGQAQQTFEHAVELARETVELVRIQYEAGNSTQVDLLQAQDNLVAAQEALAQAHFDVAVADLTVRRAAGTFPGKK